LEARGGVEAQGLRAVADRQELHESPPGGSAENIQSIMKLIVPVGAISVVCAWRGERKSADCHFWE